MFKTEFSNNPNGKLFMEHFNDVRMYNGDKHFVGAEHEIWLRNYLMGSATVSTFVTFRYTQIRDVLGFTVYGKPSHYMGALMKKFYPDINNESILVHLVFHYQKRNMQVQDNLMREWWKEIQSVNVYEESVQQTLGI